MTAVKKPAVRTAEEIAVEFKLTPAAAALLHKGESWPAYFNRLVERELYEDAIRFAAYALPKKQAVWWGTLCLWNSTRPTPPAEVDAILKAVVTWLKESSEENRRTVEQAGKQLEFAHPAGSLALAVFTSGGSISPKGLPEVEPAPALTAKAIALVVGLLAKKAKAKIRESLALVPKVASGKIPFGDPAALDAAIAPAKEKVPAVIDESVGKDLMDESVTPATAPKPAAGDDWANLPRTPSSKKKLSAARHEPRPEPDADESIGKDSTEDFT